MVDIGVLVEESERVLKPLDSVNGIETAFWVILQNRSLCRIFVDPVRRL